MSQNKGAISRESGDVGILETWARCAQMSAGRDDDAFYVPWEAIVVDDRILPRHIDADVVERYAEVAAELPPVLIQRGTYILIDGLHRLRAAPKAGRDMILVREADVPDEQLALAAFEANLSNGLPYTQGERIEGMKLMLRAYPELSDTMIAKRCGVHRETVGIQRRRMDAQATKRKGIDGRTYDTTLLARRDGIRHVGPIAETDTEPGLDVTERPKRPVTSFDPGAEPDPWADEDTPEMDEPGGPEMAIEAEPEDDPGAYQARGDAASEPEPSPDPAPVADADRAAEMPDVRTVMHALAAMDVLSGRVLADWIETKPERERAYWLGIVRVVRDTLTEVLDCYELPFD